MAAEREARRRESLAANVERAEVEREYRRLREEERKANERAEARKKEVDSTIIQYNVGGWGNEPLRRVRTTLGEKFFRNKPLKGAQDPIQIPNEITNYLTINSDLKSDTNQAYQGLKILENHITDLLKTEEDENKRISLARATAATINSGAGGAPNYTPMSEEARAAHERLIKDESTSPEMRAQLKADLDVNLRNMQEYQARGGVLSAEDERYLSEDVYRGGSNYTREQKDIAGRMLAAAGSRYDVADFNRSASSIQVTQLSRSQSALEARYRNVEGRSNDIDSRTKEALRVNQQGAAGMLSTLFEESRAAQLTGDRSRYGYRDAQGNFVEVSTDRNKTGTAAAGEAAFARQDAAAKERLAVIEQGDDYVNSILKVSGGLDLSSSAFFGEQVKTEKRFGSEWASAGGETAEDAMRAGKDATSYSRFKGLPDNAGNEYILVGSAGKQRYTLRTGLKDGGFAVYGWSGDLVSSGTSLSGLADALKDLDVPFDEKRFNAAAPEKGAVAVRLAEMTDISGIDTAATYRAELLGTLRSNESVQSVESERRAAEKAADVSAALGEFDKAMNEDVGYSLRIQGAAVDAPLSPGLNLKDGARSDGVVRRSEIDVIDDPQVAGIMGDISKGIAAAGAAAASMTVGGRIVSGLAESARRKPEKESDFVVSTESDAAKLGDALIDFSESVKDEADLLNAFAEDTLGIKLFSTDIEDKDKSVFDYAVKMTESGSKGFGLFGMLEYPADRVSELVSGSAVSAEPTNMQQVARSAVRQTMEVPAFAGSLIKIGDSVKSSYDEGGSKAAVAAAEFWGAQAATGLIGAAVKNPKELAVDLEAGLFVGPAISAGARPFTRAAMSGLTKAARATGRGTGLVDPTVLVMASETGGKEIAVQPQFANAMYALKGNPETGLVELIHTQDRPIMRGGEIQNFIPPVNSPDAVGGVAYPNFFGTTNAVPDTGGAVNAFIESKFFAKSVNVPLVNENTIIKFKNVNAPWEYLEPSFRAEIETSLKTEGRLSPSQARKLRETVQDIADREDKVFSTLTPKSAQGGGFPENEAILVFPRSRLSAVQRNEMGEFVTYNLPNRTFGGFDSAGHKIIVVDYAKGEWKGMKYDPNFLAENLKNTIADTRFDSSKMQFYSDMRMRYYRNLFEYQKGLLTGERKATPLDVSTYGLFDKNRVKAIADFMKGVRDTSNNPAVRAISDEEIFAFAVTQKGTFIYQNPIPKAAAPEDIMSALARNKYLDSDIKEWGLDPEKFRGSLAEAIELNRKIEPNIINKAIYRPSEFAKLGATGVRLDSARFGKTPDPKRLFMADLLNEPWSAETGLLLPNAPKRMSRSEIDSFIKSITGKTDKKALKRARKMQRKAVRDGMTADVLGMDTDVMSYGTGSNKKSFAAAFTGLGLPAIPKTEFKLPEPKGASRPRSDPYKVFENKKGGYDYAFKPQSRYSKYYESPKKSAYTMPDYRRDDRNYLVNPSEISYPKFTGYGKSKPYKFEGYSFKYKGKGPDYTMSKYLGNSAPYINSKIEYKSPMLVKDFKDIIPQSNERVRRLGTSKKKDRVKKADFGKFRVENTEIPIVRGEEALFSKPVSAFKLPANKKTFYTFGNMILGTKPKVSKKTKRRRS